MGSLRFWVAALGLGFFALNAQAQPFPMRAELTSGQSFETSVDAVTEWGFWLVSGEGLQFRQVRVLETRSETLRDRVLAVLPEADVVCEGDLCRIRFDDLDIPPRPYRPKTALTRLAVAAGPSIGSRLGAETSLDLATRYTGPVLLQLAHNVGWMPSRSGLLGGYTVGAGAEVPVGPVRVMVVANVWKRYLTDNSQRVEVDEEAVATREPDAYSLSVYGERRLGASPYGVRVGVRYFLKDVELDEPESRIGAVLEVSRHF